MTMKYRILITGGQQCLYNWCGECASIWFVREQCSKRLRTERDRPTV